MAAIKPREKNYIYGENKRKLELSVKSLKFNNYLIFRFGKIKTKMSEGHKNPPFTYDPDKASKIILKKMNKNEIVYPTFGLRFIAILLTIIPKKIIDTFGM